MPYFVKGWKKIFHVNGNQKKARVSVLKSDKIDFKIKAGIREKQGKTLHNDQGINPRRHNNYKYICSRSQHRSTSIHKANANSHKRGSQQ